MRRILLLIALNISLLCVHAQKTVQGSGFLDDWSVSALVGTTTPLAHASFWQNVRPVYGVEMTKYIIPEFAMGAQFLTAHNTTGSATFFDETNLMLLGNVNLSNWFGSYIGRPRSFELIAVFGAGWGHQYYTQAEQEDYNYMSTKFGLNLKFFLDRKHYAWALAVKPSIFYNMDNGHSQPTFNVNKSEMELLVGLTYHFKNANNGKHHFTHQRAYNPTEIDMLNAKVNDLLKMVDEKDRELLKAKKEIELLKAK